MTSTPDHPVDPCAFSTDFGDGTYRFRLKLQETLELEEKCDAGIGLIYQRLYGSGYTWQDVRETIRLALIGGGLAPVKALTLTKRYVDERPIDESWLLARTIIGALMHGVVNDPAPTAVPRPAEAPSATDVEPEGPNDEDPSAPPTLSSMMKSRFGERQQP